jgi:hypothetical protein
VPIFQLRDEQGIFVRQKITAKHAPGKLAWHEKGTDRCSAPDRLGKCAKAREVPELDLRVSSSSVS